MFRDITTWIGFLMLAYQLIVSGIGVFGLIDTNKTELLLSIGFGMWVFQVVTFFIFTDIAGLFIFAALYNTEKRKHKELVTKVKEIIKEYNNIGKDNKTT